MSVLKCRGKKKSWYFYFRDGGKLKGINLGTITKAEAEKIKAAHDAKMESERAAKRQRKITAEIFGYDTPSNEVSALLTTNPDDLVYDEDGNLLGIRDRSKEDDEAEQRINERYTIHPDDFWAAFEEHCLDKTRGNKAAKTIENYRYAWREFVKVTKIPSIDKVDRSSAEYYRDEIKKQKKDGGIYNSIAFLSSIYTIGKEKLGLFQGENPFPSVQITQPTVMREKAWLTREQRARAIEIGKDTDRNHYLATAIMGYAGLRTDEVPNLLWTEVDLTHRVIRVRAHQADKKKSVHEFKPKWNSQRDIPICDELLSILQEAKNDDTYVLQLNRNQENAWRFPGWNKCRTEFKLTVEDGPYTLRHTFGSLLAQAGTPIIKISKWMGHKSIKTTEKHYLHFQAYDSDINR